MAENFQNKYQQIFHENANCIVMNDPQFHQPVTLNAGDVKGLPPTSRKIKQAIETLDNEGILHDGLQWWAVYRVLTEQCSYPAKKTTFCDTIDSLSLEVKCKCVYANWRSFTPNMLKAKTDTWSSITTGLSDQERNQQKVGCRLMELLR